MLYSDVKKIVDESKAKYYIIIYNTGSKEKLRLFSGTNGVGYLSKGRKRYGYNISPENWENVFPVKCVSQDMKWIKTWTKVKIILEKSGMWEDILYRAKTGLEIGYENIKSAYSIYWSNLSDAEKIESIEKIDKRLVKETKNGKQADTDIIWYMQNPAKIKKMYFGKYRNGEILKNISDAIKNKIDIHKCSTASYDVSFEYSAKQNKAWYSEEFRGCGNGHYYLALNDSHALFYEND